MLFFVALEGFEPSQAEPESDVLPLHHKAEWLGLIALLRVQSYCFFFILQNFFRVFFDFFIAINSTVAQNHYYNANNKHITHHNNYVNILSLLT